MLYKLLKASDRYRFEHTVLSLLDKGELGGNIENLGVKLYCMKLGRNRVPGLSALVSLFKYVRRGRPDLVQGWMYHGNLAALVANMVTAPRVKTVWNVRHTPYDLKDENRLTAKLIKVSSFVSSRPAGIIYNSVVSRDRHRELGYSSARDIVLPNGFDCEQFRPDKNARKKILETLKLNDNTILIGHISRFHPMKDHACFIKAVSMVMEKQDTIHALMAGKDIVQENNELTSFIPGNLINERVHLLGDRDDIHLIVPALDMVVSSSAWGEGFPNVIGEAMACGVPCVVTDIGDSAIIVGQNGIVVKPKKPEKLAEGIETLLKAGQQKRSELGSKARERIVENYSLPFVVKKYEELYQGIVNG